MVTPCNSGYGHNDLGLGTHIRASYKVRNLEWGSELKKIQNKGLTWTKIQMWGGSFLGPSSAVTSGLSFRM